MTERFTIIASTGVGQEFFDLAEEICRQEQPDITNFRKGLPVKQEVRPDTVYWNPSVGESFDTPIELRRVKIDPEHADGNLGIWQARFVISGEEPEKMTIFAALAARLDGDSYAEYFFERFASIYNAHDHERCRDEFERRAQKAADNLAAQQPLVVRPAAGADMRGQVIR